MKYLITAFLGLLCYASFAQDVTSTKDLSYNADGYTREEKTTGSNGDTYYKRYNYINDVFSNAQYLCTPSSGQAEGYTYLRARNMISAPVETYTLVKKAGSNVEQVTGGELMVFWADKPYPKYKYAIETTQPISGFSPCSYNQSTCDLAYSLYYQLQESYDAYDVYGNLLQMTLKGGKKISYIYGYKSSYKIAAVENAANNEIGYNSFESLTDNGFFNYSNSGIDVTSGITGNSCFNLASGSITRTQLPANTYIVSFWKKSGTTSITGASNVITGETANGWTYQEAQVVLSGTGTITVSGTAKIDELRLYPANAMMTTYSYQPSVGVNAQCDVKNLITYYVYDNMGRIALIKDQFGNIVKKMDYGLQTQE